MAEKKSVNLLPSYLQTDKNARFLSSTLDQFIQTPELERIEGFVGTSEVANFNPVTDTYISESTPVRARQQLIPGLVFRDKLGQPTDLVNYEDLINEIKNAGGLTDNLASTLKFEHYSYNPRIDWDKLVNYDQYHWLPSGPDPILLNINPLLAFGQSSYNINNSVKLSNGMKVVFTATYSTGTLTISSGTEYIVEGVGDYIQFLDYNLLQPNGDLATTYNEVFDNSGFDSFPFDSDKKLAIVPEYVTINRLSGDLNPWSRYNRWFHVDVIKTTANLNGTDVDISNASRAQRPIIEFYAYLPLYNFGRFGIKNVDLLDDVTEFPLIEIPGNVGYYVDGILLEEGYRIIFNNAKDLYARNKIYQTVFDTTTNQITLVEASDSGVVDQASVSINYGNVYAGKSFHYKDSSKQWKLSQQHTVRNEAPLFDLYDKNGVSFSDESLDNNFEGSKIFGYSIGQGAIDPILGFPVEKSATSVGIGGYLFKNYVASDYFTSIENGVTKNNFISNGYYKVWDLVNPDLYKLLNTYNFGFSYYPPVVENFLVTATSTSSLISKAFSLPYIPYGTVDAKINGMKASVTATFVGSNIVLQFNESINQNSQVIVKWNTTSTPVSNYYYDIPLNLLNNPLNDIFDTLTLSQLSDHFDSMLEKDNLWSTISIDPIRDSIAYAKKGTVLIQNQDPIALPMIFLGNKNHSLIDSIRFVANQYSQWRFTFLKLISEYPNQNDPIEIVDAVLTQINQAKGLESNFYRSDMVPYGTAKTIRKVTVNSAYFTSYPINIEFDLESLSHQAVLVYKNSQQLIFGKDYIFNKLEGSVEFLIGLSIDDSLEFHIYTDTLGSYVPPTPTKLGMYAKFVPEIFEDDRYITTPQTMIQCHDGSLIKAFNDYRDDVILELEKRIYNNIKVKYNTIYPGEAIYNLPGAFHYTEHTLSQYNNLLEKEFASWTNSFNVDWNTNNIYNSSNYRTYNYINSVNTLTNKVLSGSWRSIFKYFYDTDRPHTHPWEMLGYTVEPTWWNDLYGSAPYSSTNVLLWSDLEEGYRRGELSSDYSLTRYRRPGLSSIIPVDSNGNLRNPLDFLVSHSTVNDYQADWQFGDFGPAEVTWRNSTFYPFAVNIVNALLYPNIYCSRFLDTSRMIRNHADRLVYKDDMQHVDPRKIKIDGYNNEITAGFINLVLERGLGKNSNYTEHLAQDLKYLTFNLVHRLGGFTSKEKLQVKINAVDPESASPGLLLPPEDYELFLNSSNPISSISISGVIVQKTSDRFIIRGYDRQAPYFTILKAIHTNNDTVLKVGGKDEDYVLWQPNLDSSTLSNIEIGSSNKFYKQGQIVLYSNQFYRVKVSHAAQATFNPTFFARLPELPTKGGLRIAIPKKFESVESRVNYNSEFRSIQEVYDVILGYGEYLKTKGFVFDYFNPDLNEVIDWNFSGKELAFWGVHNWADGNLITLSPFADYLKVDNTTAIVDNLFADNYEYSLQKSDGQLFPRDGFDISRLDGSCVIKTKNTEEGIFFAKINLIQKEHELVLNNTTVFNDTIYDAATGYRQKRIKLSGFRTKGWNGDIRSPGFIYDQIKITNWLPYKEYYPSQIVIFNSLYYSANQRILYDVTFDFTKWTLLDGKPVSQLLPNFDYKAQQFEDFYSLDIDNFDVKQQDLAQHLIGYTPRLYLSKLITNAKAEYKYYQGYIRDKGTKKAIDNIAKAGENRDYSSIEIKEEWAFRVGSYGSESSFKEIEFPLLEGSYLENPYLVTLTDQLTENTSGIVHYTSSTDLLIAPTNYSITSTFVTVNGTFDDNNIKLTTAGYVRLDDVTTTAYSKNSLLDIANNSLIQDGTTIWLGFLENGDWSVYRYSNQRAKIKGVYVNSPGIDITFVTDINHGLIAGDIISVVRFNYQVDGVYIVKTINKSNQFTVDSTLAGIVNEPLVHYGSLFKFEPVRFSDYAAFSKSTDLFRYGYGSKIWVDKNQDQKWTVLEKIKNFNSATEFTTAQSPARQSFGFSLKFAGDTLLVSSPTYHSVNSYNFGKVAVYRKLSNERLTANFDYVLNSNGQIFCQTNTTTDFGYSLAYDVEKNLYITGAPSATNVRATTSTSYLVAITSSTNVSRGYIREGVVKVSTKNSNRTAEVTKFAFTRPFATTGFQTAATTATHQNSRFGHSLYINKVGLNSATTLLVGAPGNDSYLGTGTVFAYSISGTGTSITNFGTDTVANVIITTAPVSTGSISITFSNPNQPGGTTATAVLVKTGNTGTSIIITNRGTGYTSAPTVTFTGTSMTTVGAATAYVGFIELITTATVSLNAGSKWGWAIAGSDAGSTIAISAPSYFNFGQEGIVQIFNSGLYWKQTLDSPFGYNDEFGQSLAVSKSGKYIFVGSSKPLSSYNTYGKVAVYAEQSSGRYELSQILENPIQNSDLLFGESIDISPDEDTLVITALGTNKSEYVKFYENKIDLLGETTFDNNETKFINSVQDSGAAYTYTKLDGYFVQADELLPDNVYANGRYGKSVAVTDSSIFVGAPSNSASSSSNDISRFYQFKVSNTLSQTWNVLRLQEPTVDIDTMRRICLIDTKNEILLDYLDVFDPLKGRIPGIAEQELKYKTSADPAIYSLGIANTINDSKNSWIEDHVGELWWDLSTAKYIWYEQGNEIFRKNNWGKLFPGASIDIYEWVKSDLLPSEWAVAADTPGGLSRGISGQPKYPDNSVVSVKQILNTVTGSFENVYFYWVKNKVTAPNVKSRKITAYEVSRVIADPLGYGLKYANILSTNSLAFGNIQGNLIAKNISANITFDSVKSSIPRHTEWVIMTEGDSASMPVSLLDKKFVDSLIGRDSIGNPVPDMSLSFRQKYGLGIRPQQTIFKDRFQALRNCLGYANDILANNIIVGNRNLAKLNSFEPIPAEDSGDYDLLVDEFDQLVDVSTETFLRAQLSCSVYNGKIIRVDVINQGYGYGYAPKVTIANNLSGAEIKTEIDSQGKVISAMITNSGSNFVSNPVLTVREHVAVVAVDSNSNDRWSFYKFDYALRIWIKSRTQLYNTTLYWNYVDYRASDYDTYKGFRYTINDVFQLDTLVDTDIGDYIKILNSGNGNFIVLEKSLNGDFSQDYKIVYLQNGTIQFNDNLWNISTSDYAYDKLSIDETLFDQLPDRELANIIIALKEDIFVDDFKVYWNLMFFKGVKYALTEQKLLDWAFKTSFITVKNSISYLNTSSSYTLDSSKYIEDYIKEIKPYRTKVRNFVSAYEYLENARMHTTDFDLPSYYNSTLGTFTTTQKVVTDSTNSSILLTYPWKDWTDNYSYGVKEIIIANGGSGYTSAPSVTINSYSNPSIPALAQAYIRNGKVYKIVVTREGLGYDRLTYVTFSGGNGSGATASVILTNTTTRKNVIGLKFDRYSRTGEVGATTVSYTTTTNGLNFDYELPYQADTNKFNIVATLDRKLVLSSDYDIISFSKDENGYNKDHSKFIFKNYLPAAGKVLKINYTKNINLYNAIDRVDNYYTPSSTMPGDYLPILMTGLEFPGRQLTGLAFDYTTPILSTGTVYDNGGGWNDFTSYYSRARVVSTASSSSIVLFLNTTTGIVPGQTLNFLNTPYRKVRTDTVVVSVNAANNSIQISTATYLIKFASSTSTLAGSAITFETMTPFNGALRAGDVIEITGIAATGFDGIKSISTITSSKTFIALSTGTLQVLTTAGSTTSRLRTYSLLETIEPQNRLIGNYNTYVGNCIFSDYYLSSSAPSMMEGYTATWTISGNDVDFGQGRTYWYYITGTNIVAADFVGGLTGVITTNATSLPITFLTSSTINAVNTLTNGGLNTETYYVNVVSWITTASSTSTKIIANKSMKLRNRPLGMSTWSLTARNVDGAVVTSAKEGEVVKFTVAGSNLDFASDGIRARVTGSGINITSGDITANTLVSDWITFYSEDDLPISFDVQFTEDFLTEGTEIMSFGLDISTVTNVNSYSTTITTTVTSISILDTSLTQPSTYQLTSLTPSVYEGSTATFRLTTTYVNAGTVIPFVITGTVAVSDLNTTTYTGTFVMVDGGTVNPGGQYADISFNVSSDAATTGLESTEVVWITLPGKTVNSATIYILDQLNQVYGNVPVYGYTVNGNTAYSNIRINNTGTFDFYIYDQAEALSNKPTSQTWAVNTSLSTYYVRGIVEPVNEWQGTVEFTGPGFANTLTYADFASGAITGNWVTVNTAETSAVFGNLGWYARALADTASAFGRFNLTIQIAKTSGGAVVSQGVFDCYVYSDIAPTSGGSTGGGNLPLGGDFRELL